MFIRASGLLYILKSGFKNLKKNHIPAIASIITMSICILLFGIFYAVFTNIDSMIKRVQSNVAVSVFMDADLPQDKINEIGNLIKAQSTVASATYIDEKQAWEEYKQESFDGKEELLEGFGDDNPLENSNHYDVTMSDISKQSELVEYISSLDGVRQVNQFQEIVGIFIDINKVFSVFSLSIIILLVIVFIFLIQNTINSSIALRKTELSIMKVIGAKERFILYPFIIESMIVGLVGSTIPLVIFYRLYAIVKNYIELNFTSINDLLILSSNKEIFRLLGPISLFLGLGISILGSILTLHRNLSKMS